MPAVTASPSTKVLVTGASGLLGVHCCKALLEKGFSVRATVRSTEKGEYLRNLGGDFANKDRFEYVIVKDIDQDGAFDEAVKGVDAIEHIASPVTFVFKHPDEVIQPAIKGTVGILESAKKYGPTVKRIFVMGSTSALGSPEPGTNIVKEDSWNQAAVDHVKAQGANSHGGLTYVASKVLAEQAAWEWIKKEQGVSFDLTTSCAPWLWGPILNEVGPNASARGLWSSVGVMYAAWQQPQDNDQLAAPAGNWVDVRDVARLNAELLTTEAAGGERVIFSAGPYSNQDILDTKPPLKGIPVGNPGATKNKAPEWGTIQSTEKAQRIFGKTAEQLFRPLSECVHDSVKTSLERGFIAEDGSLLV